MRFWLANTLKELREGAGISLEAVAARSKKAGTGHSQLSRFESHESWPREFDMVVAAYAAELGLDDSRDLWQLALERWRDYGTKATFGGAGEDAAERPPPSERFADLIAQQVARDRARSPREPNEMPSATANRRAAGR